VTDRLVYLVMYSLCVLDLFMCLFSDWGHKIMG